MKHTDICDILKDTEKYVDTSVTVCGWVKTVRDSKCVGFIAVGDGTALGTLQVVIDKESFGDAEKAMKATVGSSVAVKGKLVAGAVAQR